VNEAYDLFKQNGEGEPIWIETVTGLSNLRTRLAKLSSLKPGTYMVYDPTRAKFIEPFGKSA
jgi:hypothetical protein